MNNDQLEIAKKLLGGNPKSNSHGGGISLPARENLKISKEELNKIIDEHLEKEENYINQKGFNANRDFWFKILFEAANNPSEEIAKKLGRTRNVGGAAVAKRIAEDFVNNDPELTKSVKVEKENNGNLSFSKIEEEKPKNEPNDEPLAPEELKVEDLKVEPKEEEIKPEEPKSEIKQIKSENKIWLFNDVLKEFTGDDVEKSIAEEFKDMIKINEDDLENFPSKDIEYYTRVLTKEWRNNRKKGILNKISKNWKALVAEALIDPQKIAQINEKIGDSVDVLRAFENALYIADPMRYQILFLNGSKTWDEDSLRVTRTNVASAIKEENDKRAKIENEKNEFHQKLSILRTEFEKLGKRLEEKGDIPDVRKEISEKIKELCENTMKTSGKNKVEERKFMSDEYADKIIEMAREIFEKHHLRIYIKDGYFKLSYDRAYNKSSDYFQNKRGFKQKSPNEKTFFKVDYHEINRIIEREIGGKLSDQAKMSIADIVDNAVSNFINKKPKPESESPTHGVGKSKASEIVDKIEAYIDSIKKKDSTAKFHFSYQQRSLLKIILKNEIARNSREGKVSSRELMSRLRSLSHLL